MFTSNDVKINIKKRQQKREEERISSIPQRLKEKIKQIDKVLLTGDGDCMLGIFVFEHYALLNVQGDLTKGLIDEYKSRGFIPKLSDFYLMLYWDEEAKQASSDEISAKYPTYFDDNPKGDGE